METLDDKELKAIIARRDRRYDGRFFFGVRTTRIYCRPTCPARPNPENIVIFRSHSEAEKSGYRPCLRCRPDVAPGSKFLAGTANTVTRALRLIQNSGETELSVEKLASSLGVSDRHLRRLFDEHLGASPIEIIVTRRLHFAKQALQETRLPVSEIAYSSGFQSLRRFNEAFKQSYQTSPTEFRKERGTGVDDGLVLKLPIRQPYDWKTMIAFLTRHATSGVEAVEDGSYVRFHPTARGFGTVVVSHKPGKDHLSVAFHDVAFSEIRPLLARLKELFDTDHNPSDLPRSSAAAAGGIRVPGAFDPFETAVAIILGQLVSTAHAKTWQGKLVAAFGKRVGQRGEQTIFRFPTAAKLREAPVETIGITKTKAQAIRALAATVAHGDFAFGSPEDFDVLSEKLLSLRGIGPWTASLIAMRCLGNPDAFPDTDLVVRRVLKQRLVDPEEWGTSRAYLAHCVWRDHAGVKP